jgi:hypothetical protein
LAQLFCLGVEAYVPGGLNLDYCPNEREEPEQVSLF